MVPNLFQRIPDEQAGISPNRWWILGVCGLPKRAQLPQLHGTSCLILGKSQDWRCFSSQSSNSQCLCFFTCINPIPEEPQTLKLAVFSLRTCFVIVFPPKMWLETDQNRLRWLGRVGGNGGEAEICVFRWSFLTMSPWVLFDDVYVSSDLWQHTPVPKSTCWHRPVQPLLWSLWSRNPVRSDLHQPSGWFSKSPKWRAPQSATLLTVARVCNGLVTAESFLMSLALEIVAGPVCTLYMCNYI